MKIHANYGEYNAEPSNSLLMAYPLDMMDGLLTVDDEAKVYHYILADLEGFTELKEQALSEGIPVATIEEGYDPEEYPHNLVIQYLGEVVLNAAEGFRDLPLVERPKPDNRELAMRDAYGVYVRLGWISSSNTLEIRYMDQDSGDQFQIEVPGNKGLDAFYHPNSYRPK